MKLICKSLIVGLILILNTKISAAKQVRFESSLETKIVVAVIDTGIDERHPDLIKKLWQNPGEAGLDEWGNEKASNGIDDDGNGFVDDVHGWNFISNSNDLSDHNGHGTHVAGIIGADGSQHYKGMSNHVQLMVLKYYDPPQGDSQQSLISSIYYAIRMGATIINLSGGGTEPNWDEKKALQLAASRGIIIVTAAGNEGKNIDKFGYYPASYRLSNTIAVMALDKEHRVPSWSNYGSLSVQMAAPGKEIYSTLPGGKYGYLSGTSQATAYITGVTAQYLSAHPENKNVESAIKQIVTLGSEKLF